MPGIARQLSSLAGFTNPKAALEQYRTDGDTAAALLHHAHEDLQGAHVLDLGCGTGILGLGALLSGARHATLLDIDQDALHSAQQNAEHLGLQRKITFIHGGVCAVQADVVLMNPPFGSRQAHADRPFLIAAMHSAPVVYAILNTGSDALVERLATTHGYRITWKEERRIHLGRTLAHHTRNTVHHPVLLIRCKKEAL